MMNLKADCLGHVPILPSTMQDIYERVPTWSEKELRVRLQAVCLSHERMRAELEGCESLLAEDAAKIKREFQATILPSPIPYEDYHNHSQIVMCRDGGESYQAAITMAKELHRLKAMIHG